MTKILTIENSPSQRQNLTAILKAGGFNIESANSGRTGMARAMANDYELIVIDRHLPDIDGLRIVSILRHTGYKAPLIMMDPDATLDERVHGLRSGCDDYIAQPFSADEITARIESLLRRPPMAPVHAPLLKTGRLTLDYVHQELKCGDRVLHLRPTEMRLIEFMMRHAGQVLSYTMILEAVWGHGFKPTSNLVNVHVGRLRSKIDTPGEPSMIRTVRGAGYLLC